MPPENGSLADALTFRLYMQQSALQTNQHQALCIRFYVDLMKNLCHATHSN